MNYDQWKTSTPPEWDLDQECRYCGEASATNYCSDWCKKGYESEN